MPVSMRSSIALTVRREQYFGELRVLLFTEIKKKKRKSKMSHASNTTKKQVFTLRAKLLRASKTAKKPYITPPAKTFGFLGLGTMGGAIVKCLLKSGHKIIVWNRTFSKCDEFVTAGARTAATPRDVFDMADITFSCLLDSLAVKEVRHVSRI